MVKIMESISLPREGFFWVIDNEILGYALEVPKYNYEYQFKNKTHKNTWESVKPDNCEFDYDYYPRGRVMVDPTYNSDGKFDGYYVMVFADDCIKSKESKDLIIDYYNLDVPSIKFIKWMNNMREDTGIDHYTCHNCR